MPINRAALRLLQDCHTGQHGAIVTDNGFGLALSGDDDVEFSGHTATRQRHIRHQYQALTAIVVTNTQNTEPPTI